MALGALADRVRGYIPETYYALSTASTYGESAIQEKIDDVKFSLFATTVAYALEATTYDRYVLSYVSKLCTIELIPSAYDYWMNQISSESTTGTDEQISFPDRIGALEKTYARLSLEVNKKKAEFESYIGTTVRLNSYPRVSTVASDMVTSDPKEVGVEFINTGFAGL